MASGAISSECHCGDSSRAYLQSTRKTQNTIGMHALAERLTVRFTLSITVAQQVKRGSCCFYLDVEFFCFMDFCLGVCCESTCLPRRCRSIPCHFRIGTMSSWNLSNVAGSHTTAKDLQFSFDENEFIVDRVKG